MALGASTPLSAFRNACEELGIHLPENLEALLVLVDRFEAAGNSDRFLALDAMPICLGWGVHEKLRNTLELNRVLLPDLAICNRLRLAASRCRANVGNRRVR